MPWLVAHSTLGASKGRILKAVGSWYTAANQDTGILGRYIPHAWALADRHTAQLTGFQETPIRLIDMGLWLVRNLGY